MKTRKFNKKRREAVAGHIFLLPSNILTILFLIYPLFYAVYLSLTKFNGFKAPQYIGIENYANLLKDPVFGVSLSNVLVYVAIVVPSLMLFGLILAATLANRFRNKFGEFVRITTFIPTLCSLALMGTVFFFVFSSESQSVMNSLMKLLNLPKQNWLGDPKLALLVICFVTIWKSIGYYIVFFYAGIMDIPRDYYEAARLDGASNVQQFLHITLPCLKPVLYLVLLLLTIGSFQVFELPYTMTHGGPGHATTMPGYLIYSFAFTSGKMGYASAYALVIGVIIFAVSMLQRVVLREKVGEE